MSCLFDLELSWFVIVHWNALVVLYRFEIFCEQCHQTPAIGKSLKIRLPIISFKDVSKKSNKNKPEYEGAASVYEYINICLFDVVLAAEVQ